MSIIRRLIFKEWLQAWWGSVFIFFLLVSVGNIISELLRAAAPFADIMKHYVLELPKWMGQILPVACLTAGLFSVQKLKNRNELIAIFASGFSRQSFVMAILQVAGMVALLQLLLAGWVGPMARSARSEWLKEQNRHFRSGKGNGIQNTKISSGKIWYRGEDYFASFAIYQKETQELHDLSLYYFDQNNKITQWITAARAQYDLHNKSWRGHHGHHYWNLAQEDFQQGEIFPQKILPLQELPQDFADFDSDITALDLLNLYRYVSKIEKLGLQIFEFKVLFFEKIASAPICLIFALMGIGGIFTPSRRGSSFGKNVIFTFVFTLIYWFLFSMTLALGGNGTLTPFWGAFLMPIICVIYLCFSFFRQRSLS